MDCERPTTRACCNRYMSRRRDHPHGVTEHGGWQPRALPGGTTTHENKSHGLSQLRKCCSRLALPTCAGLGAADPAGPGRLALVFLKHLVSRGRDGFVPSDRDDVGALFPGGPGGTLSEDSQNDHSERWVGGAAFLVFRLFVAFTQEVASVGGIVRSCENYGLKRLPHRFRSQHASAGEDGRCVSDVVLVSHLSRSHESRRRERYARSRYHYVGRHVAMYFDCSPTVLPDVEQTLRMHTDVLRFTTLRKDAKMDLVNSTRKDNPWLDTDELDEIPDQR